MKNKDLNKQIELCNQIINYLSTQVEEEEIKENNIHKNDLAPVDIVSHSGSKPISIVWKLRNKLHASIAVKAEKAL